jgi:hypothetical protein
LFGEESKKTCSHGINLGNTFDGGTTAGWFKFFEDGVTVPITKYHLLYIKASYESADKCLI